MNRNEKTHEEILSLIQGLEIRIDIMDNRLGIHKKEIAQIKNRIFNLGDRTIFDCKNDATA